MEFLRDPNKILSYALNHGPLPEHESVLEKYPFYAWKYAMEVIKDRFLPFEDSIGCHLGFWGLYLMMVGNKHHSEEDQWGWLNSEGLTDKLFEILNATRMAKSIQEHIIQNHPDLIGQICDLDQDLKDRYKYELNLAGIEI